MAREAWVIEHEKNDGTGEWVPCWVEGVEQPPEVQERRAKYHEADWNERLPGRYRAVRYVPAEEEA